MSVDRVNSGSDTGTDVEAVDKGPAANRHSPLPMDKPGTAGYASRAESRAGAAAANEAISPVGRAGSREGEEESPADRSMGSRPVANVRGVHDPSTTELGVTVDDDDDDAPQGQFKGVTAETEIEKSSVVEARETPDYESPEEHVARRAGELQQQLPEKSRGRVTMAVGIVEDDNGDKATVVGTSEPRGYLRPGVSLEEGEVVAPGHGHAETDIIDWAEQREQSVITIGAGRPICPNCAEKMRRVDARPATRLKEEM